MIKKVIISGNSECQHDDKSLVWAFIVIRPPCECTLIGHCHYISNSFNTFCQWPYFRYSSVGVRILITCTFTLFNTSFIKKKKKKNLPYDIYPGPVHFLIVAFDLYTYFTTVYIHVCY